MVSQEGIERAAIFAEEDFVVEAQTFLHSLMEEKGVSRSDLARAMGVSRARVTQIFSDECKNFTVRLLARATHALGETPKLGRKSDRKQNEKGGWAAQLLRPEDIESFWDIKSMFEDVRAWIPSNDHLPCPMTKIGYSELEWEAA